MPITFDDIFGQEAAIELIHQAYCADRLPHGLIFAGPAGVGKATTARALGQVFLCEKPKPDATPCGRCSSCRAFDAGNHPDFHVITKELIRFYDKSGKSKAIDLSIQVIRPELVDKAALKPGVNIGKVFVIEEAELMNSQAQNAMLKTLEEPSGRTLIILLADQPTALLATVRSRCQVVQFQLLEAAKVRSELVKRGIDTQRAAQAASLADGSLGRALRWLEDGVVEASAALFERLEAIEAGDGAGDLPDWMRKAADAYAEKQLKRDPLGSKEQATRQGLTLYLGLGAQRFRSHLLEAGDVGQVATDMERNCSAIDVTVQAEEYLDSNVTIALVLQQWAIALERLFDRRAAVKR